MSFHSTAQDIRVDDNHILRARLQNNNGDWVDAEMDLNTCLANNNGHFEWTGQGFSNSIQSMSFSIEGGANVPILRAQLLNVEGQCCGADVNLAERIANEDGRFVFI
ncbi:hypothetical protein HYFRA_00004913 [Hymenoscyphus fraxineus]|uniref:Cyanovirin-N domain-containing protein n=1 Tax=Hymenoscyphus fraxineus TaxID=746836 RepID=A0A9N9KM97_9HELO|nr:hypothetical protein HYFRA_00004913 [Hymenoscyphus fraxineus]